MQKTTPLKSGVALFCGVWFDAYGSSESAFLFLDTKNGAIAPVVIIHLLLQQPLISLFRFNAATEKRHSPVAL